MLRHRRGKPRPRSRYRTPGSTARRTARQCHLRCMMVAARGGGGGHMWGGDGQPFIRDLGYTRVVVPREDWERRPFRTSFLLACCPCFLGNPCVSLPRRFLDGVSFSSSANAFGSGHGDYSVDSEQF